MKKFFTLCLLLCGVSLAVGCGSSAPDVNTISVDKKGGVTYTIVEDFDKDYYDEDELADEINEEIADFNRNYAVDHMTLKSFDVKDGVATLRLKFDVAKYYASYSGLTLFVGSVEEAMEEGYDLSSVRLYDSDGVSVDYDDIEKANAVITEESIRVETPTKIIAASRGVTIADKKQAATDGAEIYYIIYK